RSISLPHDDEAAIGQPRHCRLRRPLRQRVHAEFAVDAYTLVVVALAVNGPTRLPRDDIAGGKRCHRRQRLVANDSGVDAEFSARRRTAAGVALAIDAIARAVLTVRSPDRNKGIVCKPRYGGELLRTGGVRVDAEFPALARIDGQGPLG